MFEFANELDTSIHKIQHGTKTEKSVWKSNYESLH